MSKRKQAVTNKLPLPAAPPRLPWWMPLLVAAATFFVFYPTLKNGFVNWDDTTNLLNNPNFRGLDWSHLKWMFTTFLLGPYQPVSWLTFGLDYQIWGMDPFGYHLSNLILHSANAAVFYLIFVKLIILAAGPAARERETDIYISAGFAALFFSIHPLRVESVAWATERRDVLSCFFYLLTILSYIQTRYCAGGKDFFWRKTLLPLAVFTLALLSKVMTMSLPLVLIILDIYPLKRLSLSPNGWSSPENRKIWLEKAPYFILAAVLAGVGYFGQNQAGALSATGKFGFSDCVAQALFSAGFYIWKTLIPHNLMPLYQISGGLINLPVLLGGVSIVAFTSIALALRRNYPAILTAWAYYLITFSPVSGIVNFGPQSAADRYTYIPCLGFAVLAGAAYWACRQLSGKTLKSFCVLAACLILAVYARLTWQQSKIWRDSETLWTYSLTIDPELDFAHNNLASDLWSRGKTEEALLHLRKSLQIHPGNIKAHLGLGIALAKLGKLDEAVKCYREALDIDLNDADIHYNLGLVLDAQGKFEEAAAHYRETVRLKPDLAQAYVRLGIEMGRRGGLEDAVKYFSDALRINPDYAEAHSGLGITFANQGKHDEAIKHLQEALRLKPDSAQIRRSLEIMLETRPAPRK